MWLIDSGSLVFVYCFYVQVLGNSVDFRLVCDGGFYCQFILLLFDWDFIESEELFVQIGMNEVGLVVLQLFNRGGWVGVFVCQLLLLKLGIYWFVYVVGNVEGMVFDWLCMIVCCWGGEGVVMLILLVFLMVLENGWQVVVDFVIFVIGCVVQWLIV